MTKASALALLIGVIAGIASYVIGMPLPWMLGPMIGVTAAAMLRLPVKSPDKLRPVVIPVIGVMLGSGITPDILGEISGWLVTLALLPLFLCCAAGVSFTVYRRIGRYDPVTAFYAAMPGGLNEMLLLGEAAGGDSRRIALAHAARVLLVILCVALFFGLFLGVRAGPGNSGNWTALGDITALDYAILGLCALFGIPFGKLLRLPAGPVFGPMILSGAAHVIGWVEVPPPTLLIIAAQIVIGTVIGGRFVGATMKEVGTDLALALGATLGMIVVAIGFAEIITQLAGMPLSQAFLAFSPGGLTEMSLLTLAMGQDVAFVSVTHIVRITVVIAVAPILFTLFQRRFLRNE
ncbi:hypothetical protein SAMN04488515_2771 [Cognatiyoonia koreensis]|uniref:Ammonia monooxygenase n=1 Tax=Cognatiyoonia koreensis TaxID=364200 RepID=A0A1I0RJ65_9RHOB|nr:AbrB family transcriptional regulator [Cognatiyoonia koreensis]SEW41038.1 hypothetical protein SAMN04488515_2771 [Cognatiyoonia koreensis]